MASGDSLAPLMANMATPPTNNHASYSRRNIHPVLNFDQDTEETVYFTYIMPQNYSSGGITAVIPFAMRGTVVTGNVVWGISFERVAAGLQSLDSDGFAAEKTVVAVVASGIGELVYPTLSFSFAEADGILAGEYFRMRLARKAGDASDNALQDAQLVAVHLKET